MDRVDYTRPEVESLESVAISIVSFLMLDQKPIFSDSITRLHEKIQTKDGVIVFVASRRLASVSAGFETKAIG
jgi:hypothetical protein